MTDCVFKVGQHCIAIINGIDVEVVVIRIYAMPDGYDIWVGTENGDKYLVSEKNLRAKG